MTPRDGCPPAHGADGSPATALGGTGQGVIQCALPATLPLRAGGKILSCNLQTDTQKDKQTHQETGLARQGNHDLTCFMLTKNGKESN